MGRRGEREARGRCAPTGEVRAPNGGAVRREAKDVAAATRAVCYRAVILAVRPALAERKRTIAPGMCARYSTLSLPYLVALHAVDTRSAHWIAYGLRNK